LHEGFVDQPDLSDRERTLIAHWAARFSPDTLSKEQRALLDSAPPPSISPQQREFAENQRELHSPYLANLFESLTEEQQAAIQDPASSGVAPNGYPLTVGQLAILTDASERQIRNWADGGLLPSHREGKDRRFYSAAAIRAFALVRAPVHSKAIAAAAARGEVGQHFQLLAATLARAASKMPVDLRGRLTALAEDLSSSSRLMVDVGDAVELQTIWREIDLTSALIVKASAGIVVSGTKDFEVRTGKSATPYVEGRRSGSQPDWIVTPAVHSKGEAVIKCKVVTGRGARLPLDISEADEILYAKYGGTEPFLRSLMVLTAPRPEGGWVNLMPGRKKALSVHGTKADAEARGRAIARERHLRHVVFHRDGLIARSTSYG
jgi:hypothetical protein